MKYIHGFLSSRLKEEKISHDESLVIRYLLNFINSNKYCYNCGNKLDIKRSVTSSGYKETKYIFTPTCVGTVGEVTCENCGKTFEFRSL